MYRLVIAAVVLLTTLCTSAPGAPVEPKGSPARAVLSAELSRESTRAPRAMQLRIDRATEVLLNGRPCRYEDVPRDAAILRMEVDEGQSLILRIHFRSPQ